MSEQIAPSVPGGEQVVQWFGGWPSFSDAEVLELNLRRRDRSSILVHAWRMTSEIDARGYYTLDRHAVITIWLKEITDLELADFSGQNVIANLDIKPHESGFRVTLWPIYGVGGHIDAERVAFLSNREGRANDRIDLRPNMALQRTRRFAAAQFLWFAGRGPAVQALSGGRSPLNARSLDGIKDV